MSDGVAEMRGGRPVSSARFRESARVFREEFSEGGLNADDALFWLSQLRVALGGGSADDVVLENALRELGIAELLECVDEVNVARLRLAASFACVTRRRGADDAPEVAVELTLVVQADARRDFSSAYPLLEQLFGAGDAQVCEISVGRHANLGAEGAAQVKLVEPSVRREVVESDRVREVLTKVLDCASHWARVMRRLALQRDKRADCLRDGHLE